MTDRACRSSFTAGRGYSGQFVTVKGAVGKAGVLAYSDIVIDNDRDSLALQYYYGHYGLCAGSDAGLADHGGSLTGGRADGPNPPAERFARPGPIT